MNNDSNKPGYEWTVLSVTTIGVLMATMQSSALLIALPDIMGSLHMGLFTVMWVLLIYMLITTAMIPLFGRLADMYGRKNLYVLGFAVFTIGSLLCVFASPSYQGYDLIAFRIVQAMGGALMMANGTPMVTDAFKSHRLGLGLGTTEALVIPTEVNALIKERETARATKDWKKSDKLRDKIAALGYEIKDGADGQKISKK